MMLFSVSTNLEPTEGVRLNDFISETSPIIVDKLEDKFKDMVMLIIFTTKINHEDMDQTVCEIIHFKEQEFTDDDHKTIRQAAEIFETLFNNWLNVGKHDFVFTVSHFKNRLLVDWTKNNLIGSIPVRNQRQTQTCWAFTSADVITSNYICDHPWVKTLEECECSAEELIQWVYPAKKLQEKKIALDVHGSYRTTAQFALSYARDYGISLLSNYAVKLGKRKLESNLDKIRFKEMRMSKGPRIFVKHFNVVKPDVSGPDGGDSFTIEFVTRILSRGPTYGSIRYCPGNCSIPNCPNFDGNGIYEPPPHPENFEYSRHAVTILGVGNLHGKDYVHVQNSFGLKWGRNGRADMHIKCLRRMFQVAGTEKKELQGEKWV